MWDISHPYHALDTMQSHCQTNIMLFVAYRLLCWICQYKFLTCVIIPFFLVFWPVLYLKYVNSESNEPPFWLSLHFLVPPVVHDPSHNILPVPTIPAQNAPIPDSGIMTASRKHPAHVHGLAGTNATFLVPDYIRKKVCWRVEHTCSPDFSYR